MIPFITNYLQRGGVLMNVLLINNEKLSLDLMEKHLLQFDEIKSVVKLTYSANLVEKEILKGVDVIILDIVQLEMAGMYFAKEIRKKHPKISIIIVSDSEKFAIEAFNIEVSDYILKPICLERLGKSIRRFQQVYHSKNKINKPSSFIIKTFKYLEIYDEKKKRKIHLQWRTARAKEVFIYLLHNRERRVRKDVIVDLIWPDGDLDKNYKYLYNSIYQCRQLFKKYQLGIEILSRDDFYQIVLKNIKVDVDIWENRLKELNVITKKNINEYIHLFGMYDEGYLRQFDMPWLEIEKTRLQNLWLDLCEKISGYYLFRGNYLNIINLNLKVQQAIPDHADTYLRLIKVYAELKDYKKMQQQIDLYVKNCSDLQRLDHFMEEELEKELTE